MVKSFWYKRVIFLQCSYKNGYLYLYNPQVHLMCLLMRGRYLNQVCNDLDLRGIALSLIPAEVSRVPARRFDVPTHTRFVNWYKETVSIDQKIAGDSQANLVGHIMENYPVCFCFSLYFDVFVCLIWSFRKVLNFQLFEFPW